MSIYLKHFGCSDKLTNDWKKLHVTKWILLCAGMAMAVSGYYIGSSLIILDGGHQMWILCALFWGSAGVCIVAYSIAAVNIKKKRHKNVHQSLKIEEILNPVDESNFQLDENEICTQPDKKILELPMPLYKLKSFSGGLNKDVYFKGKYIGFCEASNGMNGSFKNVHKSETLNIINDIPRKVSDELSDYLINSNKTDNYQPLINYVNAKDNETFGSQEIASSPEDNIFAKCSKWKDLTLQVQNEIGFIGIRSNLDLVFKHQPEDGYNANIVHMFDKDIE